jgi:SAM-dependent methyltransferase
MHEATDDWDEHWHAYADSAEVNPAQRYRRRLIFAALGAVGCGARVIDVGSGTGDLIADLHERFPDAELLGLELSTTGVALAASKVPSARFLQRDLLVPADVPGELRGWATHLVCSEVLEHVEDPVALLRNVLPYLAPGCRVVVTVPGGPISAFDRSIGHRRHYRPDEISDVLEQAGLQVERTRGAGFPFFNLYRWVVILRGERLVRDVARSHGGESATGTARAAMRVFDWLFRANLSRTRLGYQLVAVGHASHAAG